MAGWIASVFLLSLLTALAVAADEFRFANMYGDHMVLQRGKSVNVWGYVQVEQESCSGASVTVEFNKKDITAKLIPGDVSGFCRWLATLPPTTDPGPYVVKATSTKHGSISLSDVLFGDVYICSGQSNMQFTIPQVFNASAEIEKAANYPNIRIFTAALKSSDTPQTELMAVEQPWSVASPTSINGSAFTYFSATCWFYGRYLYDKLQYPIGLIDTDWGGTRVEAWSSPDALAKCTQHTKITRPQGRETADPSPNDPSVLWNAMIHPFLNMTIFGAVWYQGEANSGYNNYNCTFPAMIDDWRVKWSKESFSDPLFPFGFVQLCADGANNATVGGFPTIRWAQTANYGYVPNPRMQNVFMAVSTDLGDPTSPYGSVHPRDKQDVGARLGMAGLAIAYGEKNIYYTGPIAKEAKLSELTDLASVMVTYTDISSNGLELRYPYGFELGCGGGAGGGSVVWVEGTAVKVDGVSVMVEFPACASGTKGVSLRYTWRQDPCTFKMCPVYSNGLPSPPFILDL